MSNRKRAEEFCDWLTRIYNDPITRTKSESEIKEIFIQRLIIMQEESCQDFIIDEEFKPDETFIEGDLV